MDSTRRMFLGATAAGLAWSCAPSARSRPPSATRPDRAGTRVAGRPVGGDVVHLDSNENPRGPGPAARAALAAAADDAGRYTELDEPLIAAIAARHRVGTDSVLLGTGSFTILLNAALWALRRGGRAVVPHPTFGAIAAYAEMLGAELVRVPLDRRWGHDLEAMTAAATPATRLVYVCNPNNPTGTIVSSDDLERFCQRLAPRTLVVVDEAYLEFTGEERVRSMDRLVRDGLPILVVRTFSKLFGLAGLRVGYGIAPPALAASLRGARTGPDEAFVSGPAARAALASLGDDDFVATTRRETAAERELLRAELSRLGLTPAESHTNFVYFVPPGKPEDLVAAMAARGVRIGGRSEQGGCRITIGTPAEMQRARAVLAAALHRRA